MRRNFKKVLVKKHKNKATTWNRDEKVYAKIAVQLVGTFWLRQTSFPFFKKKAAKQLGEKKPTVSKKSKSIQQKNFSIYPIKSLIFLYFQYLYPAQSDASLGYDLYNDGQSDIGTEATSVVHGQCGE